MTITLSQKSDPAQAAALIYSSAPELYGFIYDTDTHSAKAFIEYEYLSGIGLCGFRNMSTLEKEGQPVGIASTYDHNSFIRLAKESGKNIMSFYGEQSSRVLERAAQTRCLVKRPSPGELYFANFGVDANHRGQGIGRQILNYWFQNAEINGYEYLVLDVASNNPRAEKLYRSLGFNVSSEKVFTAIRTAYNVPGAKEMKRAIGI